MEERSLLSAAASPQPNSLISGKVRSAPLPAISGDEERSMAGSLPRPLRSKTRRQHNHRVWRALSLDYRVLLVFVAIAVALLVGLQIIGGLSDRWNGLANAPQDQFYLWTFGPTAVLTLIGAFWSRVEYRTKQLAPWYRLAEGPRSGEKTVLLDYISPIAPAAILQAISNSDYLVALAGVASLLIKLLIVVSTGLISLDFIPVEYQDAPLVASDAFKSGNLTSLPDTGVLAADVLVGIQYLNLSYPPGTTNSYSYQSFTSTDNQSNSIIEAVVDTFTADLDCVKADLIVNQWQEIGSFNPYLFGTDAYSTAANLDVSAPNCLLKDIGTPNPNNQKPGEAAVKSTYALFLNGACAHSTGLDANRILIITGEIESGVEKVTSGNVSTGSYETASNYTILRSVQLVCKPSFSMFSSSVTLNGSAQFPSGGVEIVPESNPANTSRLAVHPWLIAEAQYSSFASSTSWDQSSTSLPNFVDPQFILIMDQNNFNVSDILQPDNLMSASKRFYKQVSAQIAKLTLMHASTSALSGTLWSPENRLVVRKLPLILMSVTSGVLIGIFLVMVPLSLGKPVLSHDPGSIAGLLSIFQKSPNLIELLKGMGLSPSEEIKAVLSGMLFHTHDTQGGARETLGIQVSDTGSKQSYHTAPGLHTDESYPWYRPFPVTTLTRIFMFVILISIIIALEFILQLSHRDDGLMDISQSSSFHYVSSFLPGLLMTSISLYFVAFDFTLRTFAPYARLKSGGLYSDSLSVNFMAKLSPTVFYISLKTAQFAVFAAALAALLGKFLTIAVSGVYSVDNIVDSKNISIWYQGWFDPNETTGVAETDGLLASLVLQANLTYPQWTYDGLVFPHMGLSIVNSTVKPVSVNSSTLNVRIPALQTKMSCSIFDAETLNATFGPDTFTTGLIQASWYEPGKGQSCGYGFSAAPHSIFGHVPGIFGSAPTYPSNDPPPSQPALTVCADFSFVWGRMAASRFEHVTAMYCNQVIELVETETTFRIPDFSIDASRPPVVDLSSAEVFEIERANVIGQNSNLLPDTGGIQNLDSWFNALVLGRDGIPLSYLGDLDFKNEVMAAIRVMQKRIQAQSLNRGLRIPAPAELANSPINGTVTNPYRLRLIQNAGSTRFLEGLLAAMLICGAVASYLMHTKQVLPKNPCSVAAVATLLADSELLSPERQGQFVPFEAEGMSSTELEAATAFQTLTFRMGWFDRVDGQGRKFTIDVVELADLVEREKEKAALLHSSDGGARSLVSEEGALEGSSPVSPISEVATRNLGYQEGQSTMYQYEGERLEEQRTNKSRDERLEGQRTNESKGGKS